MKIAFVGKGGSGKTTLAALFSRVIATKGLPVIAIDADINQHLGYAIAGGKAVNPPPLGIEIDRIKTYLRGANSHIPDPKEIIKTTPPGSGSRLLKIKEQNELYSYFVSEQSGVRLMATGGFTDEDLGVKCYHSKTGAVELLLNHIVDTTDEFVVVDMTAGADAFASGLFTRFDATFIVVEPTQKSITVFEQYRTHAEQFGVALFAIGNKVSDVSDVEFLRKHLGDYLIETITVSPYVRALERGNLLPLNQLEPEIKDTLLRLIDRANKQPKDWETYLRDGIYFHKKNAESWANNASGKDLTTQIDSEFRYPMI